MIASGTAVALGDARDEWELGGKAVQLGAAIRAGLPVPEGAALPAALVAAVAAGEPAAVAELSVVRGSLPGPLAVRSSCVGEDSAAASFAGQHLTRLNVRSAKQLIEAVTAIWRSGRDASALGYRRKLVLEGEPKMGVVVQALVEPEVAGVLFTRHPVTGADERVIEAAWGLGESVVQGLVTPDLYRIDPSGEVIERLPGRKHVAIRSLPSGETSEQPLAATSSTNPASTTGSWRSSTTSPAGVRQPSRARATSSGRWRTRRSICCNAARSPGSRHDRARRADRAAHWFTDPCRTRTCS